MNHGKTLLAMPWYSWCHLNHLHDQQTIDFITCVWDSQHVVDSREFPIPVIFQGNSPEYSMTKIIHREPGCYNLNASLQVIARRSICPQNSTRRPKRVRGAQHELSETGTVRNHRSSEIFNCRYADILATKGQILKVVVTGVPAFMSASFLHCMTQLSASTQCNMINQSKALSVPSELNAPSQRL